MTRAEVVIDERYCTGCGYCHLFCPKDCIVISGENLGSKGYALPVIENRERCNGCGICAQMCPAFAIEVYKLKS